MRIAVLEDEPTQMAHIVQTMEEQLSTIEDPVGCVRFERGVDLRRVLRRETFDLLLIDWNMLDLDSIELLRWLRQQQESWVPVLVLSSRASEHDVASAFDAGADDYVVKPFRPAELVARVRRLLTPRQPAGAALVECFGSWMFERGSSSVRIVDGATLPPLQVTLTDSEFRLALALFRNMGKTVSRAYLLQCARHNGEAPTRVIDTHVYRLRAKLGLNTERGLRLRSVYGQGYRLEPVQDGQSGVSAWR